MGKEEAAEVIGDSLIPVINKLQDIFSQVGLQPGRVRDAVDVPLSHSLHPRQHQPVSAKQTA